MATGAYAVEAAAVDTAVSTTTVVGATVVEADVVKADVTVDLCSLLDKQSPPLLRLLAVTVKSGLVLELTFHSVMFVVCTRMTTCVPSRISTSQGRSGGLFEPPPWPRAGIT